MQKNIVIIIFLILFGCGSKPAHREVMVNKTVKVFSENYHDQAENYTFKWQPPIDPKNNKILFHLKNDMLIFTPEIVGNYEVNLAIEDISEEVVSKEIFYFKAISETREVAIIKPKKETLPSAQSINAKKSEKHTAEKQQPKPAKKQKIQLSSKRNKQSPKSQITHTKYALQISAWPSLEEARKQQLELIDEGFDAYTQRFYLQKKDEVWHRVRVGNFSNREKALAVKVQIESFTGITTWLDILSTK